MASVCWGIWGWGMLGQVMQGRVWRGWWRAVVTTAPMWSVAVSGTGHVTRPGVAAPCHTVTSVASRPATARSVGDTSTTSEDTPPTM